jgi:hypothetical protein
MGTALVTIQQHQGDPFIIIFFFLFMFFSSSMVAIREGESFLRWIGPPIR